jgi:DNA repair protein RecN (Recombination protein N)
MIRHLQVKNYALIESLRIDFSEGLTIITGETGAGKSILLGALGLIMGNRADTKTLYDEDEKCVIEGFFDIGAYDLKAFFKANDLDYDRELIIRRELLPSGKSRAFVNDTPVNLKVLQQLSSSLVDLHQQFDSLDIHNVSFQLRMLDALAGNKQVLADYRERYRAYQADRRILSDLKTRNQNAAKEIDFINFQLEEFQNAELKAGEQDALEEELAVLTNAEEIKQTLGAVYQHLNESEQSIVGQLQEMGHSLGQIKRFDSRLTQLYERYDSILLELDDLAQEIERIAEDTEYNPERIVEIQTRLDLVYRLENKHGVATVEELIDIRNELQSQLDAFSDLSGEIESLERDIEEQEKQLKEIAAELTRQRQRVVPGFEERVKELLAQLAMEHAQLKVEIRPLSELGPTGLDEIQYLFAANKGSRLQLIKDVASGGELSRLTLVTKSLVASAIPLPTLIFDEIDTGVSGDIALKMGNILRQLSNQHQVVSITHSPQIASKADSHYFVYKIVREERTVTEIMHLSGEERVRAIATMLSQSPPSPSAIENAKELLGEKVNNR